MTVSATSAPTTAVRTDTAPVTSSRPAVRGLRASIFRSITRFAASANVRPATIATVTSSRSSQRTSGAIAVSAATYANGSAKTECSITTSRRNALTRPGRGATPGPAAVTSRSPGRRSVPAPRPARPSSLGPGSSRSLPARAARPRARSQPVLRPAAVHQGPHLGRHNRLLRPPAGPPVALGGQLAGRVDAQLAAPELLVGRVVEMVDRAHRVQHVVRVVHVAERPPGHLAVVVHVAVGVDDDDQLRQREQPRAPDRGHHLPPRCRVPLLDRDQRPGVKPARPS